MNPYLKAALSCLLLFCSAENALSKTLDIPLPPPGAFTTTIDNRFWPLTPASGAVSYTYMAETEDGCEWNKLTVTSDTKLLDIDGSVYVARVIRDQAWESEYCDITTASFAEDTIDYYAMEIATGDVWYFGEDTLSIDDETGLCTDEGAWEAGVGDATPGVVMLGSPKSGDRYQQEFSEDNAEDWGAVLRLNAKVSIEYGDFSECLVTREWTPLAPGEIEHKYYCPETGNPGPGLMYIEELKGKTVHVEYIGANLNLGAPGENIAYPALDDVGSCVIP